VKRHDFRPFEATALRLRVTATHGSPEARLYENRCHR
jgi:hypothetical protein